MSKGGRPSGYTDAMCREVVSLMAEGLSLTAAMAKRCNIRCVYGLSDQDGNLFYIGQTTSLSRRVSEHMRAETSNAGLKRRLIDVGSALQVEILAYDPPDLNAAERAALREYGADCVNLVGADHWSWAANSDKPWAVGTGVKTPSAYAMSASSQEVRRLYQRRLKAMSVKERCEFEMRLFLSYSERLQKHFAKWAGVAWPRMEEAVAGNG